MRHFCFLLSVNIMIFFNSTSKGPLHIKSDVKASELSTYTAEPWLKNGRQKYGSVFLQYFIGTTENAASCYIKNKEVAGTKTKGLFGFHVAFYARFV